MAEKNRPVEYVPPKSEDIRAFARSVCQALGDKMDNPTFAQPYVARGLADFMELAALVLAKHLNDDQLVDEERK